MLKLCRWKSYNILVSIKIERDFQRWKPPEKERACPERSEKEQGKKSVKIFLF